MIQATKRQFRNKIFIKLKHGGEGNNKGDEDREDTKLSGRAQTTNRPRVQLPKLLLLIKFSVLFTRTEEKNSSGVRGKDVEIKKKSDRFSESDRTVLIRHYVRDIFWPHL